MHTQAICQRFISYWKTVSLVIVKYEVNTELSSLASLSPGKIRKSVIWTKIETRLDSKHFKRKKKKYSNLLTGFCTI